MASRRLAGEKFQRGASGQNSNSLKGANIQEVTIARDDPFGICSESARKNMIVVRVPNDSRDLGWLDQIDCFEIVNENVTGRRANCR